MVKTKKKIFTWLLTLCMVFALLPNMNVKADEDPALGPHPTYEVLRQTDENPAFVFDDGQTHNVILGQDITIDTTIARPAITVRGANTVVNLCLNGHNIITTWGHQAISVEGGAKIIIDDCSENPGIIKMNTTTHYGGGGAVAALYISGASAVLNNGTIESLYQSSVHIEQSAASSSGYASNRSSFEMNGGTVRSDNAPAGRTIFVTYGGGADIKINGGTLYGNNSSVVWGYTGEENDNRQVNIEVTGGTFITEGKNDLFAIGGNYNISGGTFRANGGSVISSGSIKDLIISGGNFTAKNANAMFSVSRYANIKITGNPVIGTEIPVFNLYHWTPCPTIDLSEAPADIYTVCLPDYENDLRLQNALEENNKYCVADATTFAKMKFVGNKKVFLDRDSASGEVSLRIRDIETQPTLEAPTVVPNSDVDSVVYQWYRATKESCKVTEENTDLSAETQGINVESSYDASTDTWTPVLYEGDMSLYFYFVVKNVGAGDILDITFKEAFPENCAMAQYMFINNDTSNGSVDLVDISKDSLQVVATDAGDYMFVIVAVDEDMGFLSTPDASATLTHIEITDPIAGQTTATYSGDISAACRVTWNTNTDDAYTLTSDVLFFADDEHVHTKGTAHTAVEATCTTAGTKACWDCYCGEMIDEEGNVVTAEELVIAALGHDFSNNAKTCRRTGCDASNPDYKASQPDALLITQEEVAIPEAGTLVDVTPVVKNDLSAMVTDENKFKEILGHELTDAEVVSGAWVWLELTVEEKASVDADDAKKIEAAMPKGTKLGTFLNIEILKQIAGGERTNITELDKAITIAIVVPEELKASGRSYAIMYRHANEEVKVIEPTGYDEKTGVLTFEASQFSTYALVYEDAITNKPEEKPEKTPEKTPEETPEALTAPKTGDVDATWLWMLLVAGVGIVMVGTVTKRKINR